MFKANSINAQKLFWVGITLFVGFLGASLLAPKVSAKSYTYPDYDVTLDIHQDSTVDVTEKLTYKFIGNFSGVIRQIPLVDPDQQQYCIQNGLTCGGFEQIALLGVYDQDGKLVPPANYQVYQEDNDDNDASFFDIKWVVWPDSKDFNGQTFTWTIKYRLYGSLGWINGIPYLYWNMLPSNKGGEVDSSHMVINFPQNTNLDKDNLDVYASDTFDYHYNLGTDQITLDAEGLPADSDFTVSYRLPVDLILKPGTLNLNSLTPLGSEINLNIDGVDIGTVNGHFTSFPAGTHQVILSFSGFQDKNLTVNMPEGGVVNLDSSLTPQPLTQIAILVSLCLNIFGVFSLPLGIGLMYRKWLRSGRDEKKQSTIVPQFAPPTGMSPYLLGALKDETVDKVDVTGSIIDLAYRGYIRIKEIEVGKNYELTKLGGKPKDPGLDDIEQHLFNSLFLTGDVVETKDLGETFYAEFAILKNLIYQKMVGNGYFKVSPEQVRRKYVGIGGALIAIGAVIGVVSVVMLFGAGYLGPITIGFSLGIIGIVVMIFSNFMPARTELGSKLYADVLGFRMYLYTAERYRLQKLTPDEFEKYLSYAVVFGIEKQWAEQFKDIYKGQPDWYIGSGNAGIWNVIYISSFTRSFANSVSTTMLTQPSAKGGGWSGGGGGFGGFSGGGGGGGGSGAF